MVPDVSAVGDDVERVPVLEHLEVEDQAARRRDQSALVLDADLALGKDCELALEVLLASTSPCQGSSAARASRTLSQSSGRSGLTTRCFSNFFRLMGRAISAGSFSSEVFVDLQIVARHPARPVPLGVGLGPSRARTSSRVEIVGISETRLPSITASPGGTCSCGASACSVFMRSAYESGPALRSCQAHNARRSLV